MGWGGRRRVMLVTGGSGFLGRHLLRSDARRRWEIVAPPSTLLDITDERRVIEQITEWRPAVVVHLAYRRDRQTIVPASASIARATARVKSRLVHLSSDIVFGGGPRPYNEDDVPRPAIDYGRWKAEAEREVLEAHPSALVVRTSLLYGTNDRSPIQQDVIDAIEGRTAMTFFTDEFRCPAHADDIASAVLGLAARTDLSGVLHLAGPDPVSRSELAYAVARWAGLDARAIRTSTIAESGVSRPARIVLDSSKAAELGFRCRSLDEALFPGPAANGGRGFRRRSS